MTNTRCSVRLLTFAIFLVGACGIAHGEDVKIERFQDWELLSTSQQCTLITRLASRKTGTPIVEMFLVENGADETGAMVGVRVPNGASLKDGIAYRHPNVENAVGLAWQNCDKNMCLAAGEISDEGLTKLKKGRRISLGFKPLPSARSINVDISLMGVTQGVRALRACLNARG